jgi:hypothetical protein
MKNRLRISCASATLVAILGLCACGGGTDVGGSPNPGGPAGPGVPGGPVPVGWQTAVAIETSDAGDALTPQLAFDSNGNAVAVWQQRSGGTSDIWWNRYTPGTGWGTAAPLAPGTGTGAQSPQIAMGANGTALVVWSQPAMSHPSIWASRYTVATGWDAPVLIESNDAGSAIFPHVAVDPQGNGVVAWHQSNGSTFNIWAAHYAAHGGWEAATLIGPQDAGNFFFAPSDVQVAMDAGGNALAIWQQYDADTTVSGIWVNRFRPNVGWDVAVPLVNERAGNPQIAMDANGNALAVWEQGDGNSVVYIWASRYTPASGWGSGVQVSTGGAHHPQLSFDSPGNAVAAWQQADGMNTRIGSSRFTLGVGWDSPSMINSATVGSSVGLEVGPDIATDSAGNSLLLWEQLDGSRHRVWSSHYTPGTGWAAPSAIDSPDGLDTAFAQIAVDARGNALALWQQADGKRFNIWANRYSSGQ